MKNPQSLLYSPLENRRLLAITASLSGSTLTINGDAAANTAEVQVSGNDLLVTGDNSFVFDVSAVSLIRFYGGAGDDFFENFTDIDTIAAGHDGADTLRTAGGADRIYGGNGDDILSSGAGDDIVVGNDDNDTISGGDGADRLLGLGGNDLLNGGNGDDVLIAGFGDDEVHGGEGSDLVYGHFGNDQIFGDGGNDFLYGQDDNDTIHGGAGDDVVRGGRGIDFLRGNDGSDRILGDEMGDTMYGDDGRDIIFGGDGDDIAYGGAGNDLMYTGSGDDTAYGQDGNDVVRGNSGNDILDGGNNADRIVGDAGDDRLVGGTATDFVFGGDGVDTVIAESSDWVNAGGGDDILELSSQSGDVAIFNGNYSNYKVTQSGDTLVVRDTLGVDGQDRITGADSLRFSDGTRDASPEITQRVYVQPIVVSNNDGSNTATFFGNADQEFEIKREIDEIYLQAGVDVEWLDTRTTNNTFFNVGSGSGTRSQSDLNTIVTQGDNNGIGNSDSLVLDMYFIERVPGFVQLSQNTANGLAFVNFNGITMHTGDNLPGFSSGRSVVARVAAHEIAHNLGLNHVHDEDNLMDDGAELYNSQITTILNSQYTQVI